MNLNKMNQILRVAKLFYEEHLPQQEIANIEEISPATVSRFLKKAEELELVKHVVALPAYSTIDVEAEIKNKYNLKKVTVMPDFIKNEQTLIRDINKALLEDLNKLVKDGNTIALGWGNTITSLAEEAKSIKSYNKKDVDIVQIYGGISPLLDDSGSTDSILSIAKLLNAHAYQICAPAYVQDKRNAEFLKNERQIGSILDKAKNSDIAIFSAAPFDKEGFIFTLGSLEDKDIKELEEKQTIGDICIHFLDKDANIAVPELDERCMGLTIDEIKNIPEKILIAYGINKAHILKAVLEKSLVDRLYIDENLAKALLKLD